MQTRQLGTTDMHVSRLGLGLSEIGYRLTMEQEDRASRVLNSALDGGINFLDTSACYSISEELIGRSVSHRRDAFFLATKFGHVAGDWQGEDWTRETLRHSIDRSLKRLKTDYVDLLQMHSPGLEVLQRGDAIEELQAAQQAGKVRYIGLSDDNEAAHWGVESGIFSTLQTSFNMVDQQAHTTRLLEKAQAAGMGVITKRPIANAAWGATASPSDYAAQYFARATEMRSSASIASIDLNRILLAMGFTFAHEAVDVAIIGTQNPANVKANIEMVASQLPIASEIVDALHARFAEVGQDWVQLR